MMKYVAVAEAVKQADQKMGTAKKAIALLREKNRAAQTASGNKGKTL
jgi:hypothetical protein